MTSYRMFGGRPVLLQICVESSLAAWDAHVERTQPLLRLRHTVTRVATDDESDELVVEMILMRPPLNQIVLTSAKKRSQ